MFKKANLVKCKLVYVLLILPLLLLSVGLLVAPSARAFESRNGENIVIGPDEVIDDDLYVFAATLDMRGTVNGDLIFFGQSADIEGMVTGDLIAAGQHIAIPGAVNDDARVAAYAIEVTGDLGDDLVAAGFSLVNVDGSSVGGDLVFIGYQALLAGQVGGTADVAGGAVDVEGTVDGNLNVDVGGVEPGQGRAMPPGFPFVPGVPTVPSVPPGLTIGDDATIGGDLNYTANQRVDIPEDNVEGEVNFTRYVPEERPEKRAEPSMTVVVLRWFWRQLRRLITLLLVGALMVWLVPDWTRRVEAIVRSQLWPSLGWGLVALVLFIVGIVILVIASVILVLILGIVTLGELAGLFVGLGGVLFGAATFSFSVLWSYVTRVIVSLLLGHLIFNLFGSRSREKLWWPMLVGVLIFLLITAIPFLGWLLAVLASLFGLGALWIWMQNQFEEEREVVPAEVPNVEV